jgi:phage tail tape-measure protein
MGKPKQEERGTAGEPVVKHHNVTADEVGVVAGEIAGAVVGSAAGPVGTLAGMVLGAVVGGAAGEALASRAERARRHDEELDETIGVIGGDLGAARPGAPPARIGAPSAASAGAGSHGPTPAEGPIQDVDD